MTSYTMESKPHILFLGIIILILSSQPALSQNWDIIRTRQGLEIREADQKVLFYQTALKSLQGQYPRNNYIHPLYGLNEEILTEDFPEDHFHHRGIFWTWHQVWIGEKRIGDAWLCENITWIIKKAKTKKNQDGSLSLLAKVHWTSPNWPNKKGKPLAFLEEAVNITVYPRTENLRVIDFQISLQALTDQLFIGGSEDEKGYGGFSPRIITPENIRFTSTNGPVTPQNLAVEAGHWMDITGDFMNDKPDSGIMIINRGASQDNPQKWILRSALSMQNHVFPGNTKYEIKQDEPLILKYRLVVHQNQLEKSQIERLSGSQGQ